MSRIEDMLWQQIEPMVYIDRETFMAELSSWKIAEVFDHSGHPAFATLRRGSEFHFAPLGDGRLSIGMVKDQLCAVIREHGHVITKTPKDDAKQRRFNEAIGFMAVDEDEFFIRYRMEKLRGAPCQ